MNEEVDAQAYKEKTNSNRQVLSLNNLINHEDEEKEGKGGEEEEVKQDSDDELEAEFEKELEREFAEEEEEEEEEKEKELEKAAKVKEEGEVKVPVSMKRSASSEQEDSKDSLQQAKKSKKTVKDELKKLSSLQNLARPIKYNITPVWARKWQHNIKNANANTSSASGAGGAAASGTESSDGFPHFQSSFNNVIPDDDLTKSIQEWIYATIVSIPEEERQYIELEMKFGILTGENQVDRINPPISTQSIYTDIDGHLLPNIDANLYTELVKFFNNQQQQLQMDQSLSDFNIIESHTIDSMYRLNDFYNHRRPRFLRLSKDYNTGRISQFIEKKSISQLLIYSPKDSYDLKISLNLELPLNTNDEPPEKFEKETPVNLRNKKRISFIHNTSFTRFDLTEVVSKSMNNKNSSMSENSETQHSNTCEVELEINTPMLLKAFEFIQRDSTKYANLIRSYLNNGTIVRRKMSQLSVEIFEGKKKL